MGFLRSLERSTRRTLKRRQMRRQKITKNSGAAFLITGGVGDLIVAARFVRDLLAATGGGEFSVFYSSPKTAEVIFGSIPGFVSAHPEQLYTYAYDFFHYALKINQFIHIDKAPPLTEFRVQNTSRLVVEFLENYERSILPLSVLRDHHPSLDGTLGRYAVLKGHSRRDFIHSLCDLPYGGDQVPIGLDDKAPDKFGLTRGRYVTVHNGYDENMQSLGGGRATKAYPHWSEVVSLLREQLGDVLDFVQIGAPKTSIGIPSVHRNLIGKTSLAEAFGILAGAVFHLDNEGGLVHAAAALGKKSGVVFGPTSVGYFAYPSNLNFAPDQCGDCWWSERTWMMQCPRDLLQPVCTFKQDPGKIARNIMEWWGTL